MNIEQLIAEYLKLKKDKDIKKQKFINKCIEKGLSEKRIKELCNKIENMADDYVEKIFTEAE